MARWWYRKKSEKPKLDSEAVQDFMEAMKKATKAMNESAVRNEKAMKGIAEAVRNLNQTVALAKQAQAKEALRRGREL